MIKYIFYIDLTTCEIVECRLAQGKNPEAGLQEDGRWVVLWTETIQGRGAFMESHYWDADNGQLVNRGLPPDRSWEWDHEKKEYVLNQDILMESVRTIRNGLLNQCDWTQMPDVDHSEEKKAEWKAYRKALREITLLVPTATCKEDLPWPKRPD